MLSFLSSSLTAVLLPVLLGAFGFYLLFKLRAFPYLHPIKTVRELKKSGGDGVSPFRALTVALAGTLGVGNIVGVASAISLGGAGAIFWMWIAALFSMLIKYAETVLAVGHRVREVADDGGEVYHGGAMYYLKGKRMPRLFALLCIICSFIVGCAIQSRAAADSLYAASGMNRALIGVILAALALLVLFGHGKSISKLTVWLVPIMSVGFTVISLIVIWRGAARLPEVFGRIVREAFSLRSAAAGGIGMGIVAAVRYGVVRGLVSNEAGCGTSPIAHSSAHGASAHSQGCFGIAEVFVDTIVICTITALAILVSGADRLGLAGMETAIAAFESVFGVGARYIIATAIVCFSFATIVSWAFYGFESIRFLFGNKKLPASLYTVLYCLTAVGGAVLTASGLWAAADIIIAVMAIINICAMFNRRREINMGE